jgi:hypothetical protein
VNVDGKLIARCTKIDRQQQPTSWRALQVLYQIRSSGGIFWKVFRATEQVCWAHCQVSESSDGSGPFVRDDRNPSRWEPRCTHVSHWCHGIKLQSRFQTPPKWCVRVNWCLAWHVLVMHCNTARTNILYYFRLKGYLYVYYVVVFMCDVVTSLCTLE